MLCSRSASPAALDHDPNTNNAPKVTISPQTKEAAMTYAGLHIYHRCARRHCLSRAGAEPTTALHTKHTIYWAHDVAATLNQRQWRWFNVAATSCAKWDTLLPGIFCSSMRHADDDGDDYCINKDQDAHPAGSCLGWVSFILRRFLHNHGNIATERSPNSALCPTLIERL